MNIASVHGFLADRQTGAYDAAKAGVMNLTRTLALEYAEDNIYVNCICPGAIMTRAKEQYEANLAKRQHSFPHARTLEEIGQVHALRRMGKPEEVAKAVLFLASDDASFVTGEALVVGGGLTIGLNA